MRSEYPLIMIVDDSATNIDILVGMLKDQYRLTIAKTGARALELTKRHLPDLILLDLVMPGMDGFEVCERLKAEDHTRDIPVIFITAMDQKEQKTRGFELGAVDYITRPFHSGEVMARVKTHIAMGRMNEALREKNRSIRRDLDEKNRQLDALIGNLPGMVYRCRRDGGRWNLEFMSEGCRKMTGYGADHFMGYRGRHYDQLAVPKDLKRVEKDVDKALENQEPFQQLYRIHTLMDNEKWVLEQGAGIYDAQGQLLGMEGVVFDVTEKQHASIALAQENKELKKRLMGRDRFGDILGGSDAMQRVYRLIVKAASMDDCVVIYGDSGTGKELVARAIHKNSSRKERPFVPVNCGAVPESLFESEFFGHKKGAFSGADTDKTGILDMAEGGTLFLDELGEISVANQVKLLRVMDGNGYIPVGGTEVKRPDIRFICATNRNLQRMVRQKKIREDFFFRVHIVPITLPALRERSEDIPLLVEHFINSYPKTENSTQLTDEMMGQLVNYAWPGNVRQLQNVIYQFLSLGRLEFLDPDSLSHGPLAAANDENQTLKEAVAEFEKDLIHRTLTRMGRRKGRASKALGVDRKTLFRKMKRYGIKG
ncbi:MAG: sigma 54-interacting transcriptional regulator [Desulfobacterales bacterium]|nr:sigma 54-interacting transcriptional regulator [Desulfobacterales bacterium]